MPTGPNPADMYNPGDVPTGEVVGSGPGGLSTALTCIQKGLSYVVLEKEQMIASTISRYPKGKLVMAEPYDTQNLSLLPVFDAGKEQLIPIWRELLDTPGALPIEHCVIDPDARPNPSKTFEFNRKSHRITIFMH